MSVCGNCIVCGKEKTYKNKDWNRKAIKVFTCSLSCWYEFTKRQTEYVENTCPVCGSEFRIKKSEAERYGRQVACSLKCGRMLNRKRVVTTCERCKVLYEVVPSALNKKYNKKFCSKECFLGSMRNRIISVCERCGKKFIRGKAATERSSHVFCSMNCSSEWRKGENSPSWRGGKSSETHLLRASAAFSKWRNDVFSRDNFTCQMCGVRGGKLHPHHIKSFAGFPKERFDLSNGMTLCENCHQALHGNAKGKKKSKQGNIFYVS